MPKVITDDLIVREALLNLRLQYQWWMGTILTTESERDMAAEKLIRIERTLQEVPACPLPQSVKYSDGAPTVNGKPVRDIAGEI